MNTRIVSNLYQSIFTLMTHSTRFTHFNPFTGISILFGTSTFLFLCANLIKNKNYCLMCGKSPPCNTECNPYGLWGYITYYFTNKNKCLIYS